MRFSVVFLKSAEQDVKELKHYIVNNLGNETWHGTLGRLRDSINALKTHSPAGKIPDELTAC